MGELLKIFIGKLHRTRWRGLLIGAVALELITLVVAWSTWPTGGTGVTFERERVRANLVAHLEKRAKEETAKLDAVRDWQKIATLTKARDRQLANLDRLLERIARRFKKKEVSAQYTTACRILAGQGPVEALRLLESNTGARERKISVLKRAHEVMQQSLHELLHEKLLAAFLLEKDLQWDKAEAVYRAVVRDGGSWPEPRQQLADFLYERGVVEPEAGDRKLGEAAEVWRDLLLLQPRDEDPESWAITQTNLGNTLWSQGKRLGGPLSLRLLGEAVTAYRAALEVYTREQSPQDWATTQKYLGLALSYQATRSEGPESLRLLNESVTAYHAALEVYTREQSPKDWAMTQYNLGLALSYQGKRTSGAGSPAGSLRLLGEAVTAFRAALTVYTREQSPQDWASTQYNLASALMNQGQGRGVPEREGGASDAENMRLDGEAVTAYRAALEIYTREQVPQDWAHAQFNLGGVLTNQSMHAEDAEGKRLLGEALTAYRASLEIYTRKELPQDWASTQFSIAFTLRALADRSETAEAKRLRAEAEVIDKELAAQP